MKTNLKRLTALILALSMALSLLSTGAWAADLPEGTGTVAVQSEAEPQAEPEEEAGEPEAEESEAEEPEPEESEPEESEAEAEAEPEQEPEAGESEAEPEQEPVAPAEDESEESAGNEPETTLTAQAATYNVASTAQAATYNVASLTELQTVLSTATSETEIIVTALISLPNGTVLDGHGATVRVTTPYLNEDGKTASGYSTINVFSISSGTVTLRNMTIMGGFAGINREFGAVRVSGSGTKLQMDNVTLTRSGRGLSIVDGSVAVLRNCNIVRNMNSFGGGIQCYNNSTLIMDACSFSENRAYYYGGGAMEIQESKMYANNTVICNNSTQSNGGALHAYGASIYLLNCTMSGNVTGGNSPQGAGIGTNSAANKNSIYAANCVLMNNYRIPGGNKTPVECDFGYINPQKGVSLEFHNSLYGSVDSGLTLTGDNNKTDTADAAAGYRADGVLYSVNSSTFESTAFSHPILASKDGTNGMGLYAPMKLDIGKASSGGCDTYFDYSDTSNIKMSYGSSNSPLGDLAAADTTHKVTTYYEGGTRSSSVIGASKAVSTTYYTVKLDTSYSNGMVSGATTYGDSYPAGTEITISAYPNSGYVLKKWTVTTDNDTTVTANPYSFTLTANTRILPEFAQSRNVTYDANGGTGTVIDTNSPYASGSAVNVLANTLTREGYTFAGWKIGTADTVYANSADNIDGAAESFTITADTTLTAQWKAKETAPDADSTQLNISYPEETITAKGGYEIAVDNNGTAITDFSAILDSDTPTVYVRKLATDANHAPSDWVAVTLAARPAAPTGLTAEPPIGTADGKIKGTTTAMEYKLKESTDDWTAASTSETAVASGTYLVRTKATNDTPAGKAVEILVVTATQNTTDLIDALPAAANVTTADKDAIEAARAAYNALTDAQKEQVSTDTLKKLTDAEDALAAATASATINALPAAADVTLDNAQAVADAKAAYDALTDDQKALVPADTVSNLNAAVAKIADLTAANTASGTISALPDFGDVTTNNKAAIEAARATYNALTADQKALVSADTLKKLTDAEDKLVILQVMSEVSAKTGSGMAYTGSPIQLINTPTTALPEGYTMKYAVTTENVAPTDGWDTSIPAKTDAGTYYVWYMVVGDDNHNDSAPASVKVTVAPKQVGLKWSNTKFTYDGKNHYPTVTATGLASGDKCTVSITGGKTGAGTHTATASKLSNTNYKLPSTKTTKFTIAKASQKAPAAPVVTAITGDSLTVKTVKGQQYSIDGGKTWKTATGTSYTFKKLTSGKAYTVVARKAATANYNASPASAGNKAKTLSNAMLLRSGLKIQETTKDKKTTITVTFGAVPDATSYRVYVQYCGSQFDWDTFKTIKNGETSVTLSKINGSAIKADKAYKVRVVAMKGDTELCKTPVVHGAGAGSGYTDIKSVTLNKTAVTLAQGGTFTIKPTLTLRDSKKKSLSDSHDATLRFLSSDSSVATVDSSGKITARGAGTCVIMVTARNGITKSITVTVK